MGEPAPETAAAVHDLLAAVAGLEHRFTGEEAVLGTEASVLDGYRWMFSILAVGLDAYVWADPARPRFVDIVGPTRKWGGDNADAFYQYAIVDPARTYRVTGRAADAVYFSLTVYGGPADGHYSERIVGSVHNGDLAVGDDGTFAVVLGPARPPGWDGPFIALEHDAVCAITRDYLEHPGAQRRMTWAIECIDERVGADTPALHDAELARRFRAAATWVRDQAALAPLHLGEADNAVDDPYPVPQQTFGWAAGDAAYAMGRYALGDGEALVIRGRSPACRFWNLCLWNEFLHTYDYAYGRVTINGAEVVAEADGSWTIVVSADDPGHPNWLTTQGRATGNLWFRWFLPEHTPIRPACQVVSLSEVPPAPASTARG